MKKLLLICLLILACEDESNMVTLYADLDKSAMADITAFLKENKYKYKLEKNDSTILVPIDSLYKIRMNLAKIGLPKDNGKAYKFFDKEMLDITANKFNRINRIRAIQTELARSVETLSEVEKTRIYINIKDTTAVVIVKLHTDKELQERQIKAIQRLVASAAEPLKAERVSVIYDKEDELTKTKMETKYATIQDPRDGKTYKTTKIGEQIWLAENLNYAAKGSKCGSVERIVADYRERDSIRAKYDNMGIIIDFADYANTLKDENTEYCDKYGRLYNWKTATTACPKGWRMPNNSEWQKLITAIGGNSTASIKLKAKSWGNGTDDYNFTALPGGYANNDSIFHPGITAEWWSLTEHNATQAYSHKITYSPSVRLDTIFKSSYGSLRCIKD